MGEAISESLLAKNYLVFGGSRTSSSIDHPNFFDLELDIRREASVSSFYREVASETEVVDLLVNNAGICEMSSFQETSSLDFANHFSTNTLGAFHMLKGFEPFIIEDESYVINVLATAALEAYAGTSAYTSAEMAKKGMLEVVEKEWSKFHLRFTNFILGAVHTPLWDDYEDVDRDQMLSIEQVMEVFNLLLATSPDSKVAQVLLQPRKSFLK